MTLLQLFRVLNRNLNILFLCSIALAVAVFFFTRGLPKTYESITEIYTGIASGMDVENIGGGGRVDYHATNNEYSNLFNVITSKQTAIEVGERLLARHLMLDGPEEHVISKTGWEVFNARVPQDLQDSLLVEDSLEETLKNVQDYRISAFGTYRAQQIFENSGSPYSHEAISKVNVQRVGSSDLIQLKYSWSDPGICMNTLEVLNKVFSKRLLDMKVERSEDVVGYYRNKVEEARLDLENAEQALVDFRIENKIIDYGEQTRSIASSKKEIESQYQEELQAQAAARAKVDKLEKQLALNKKGGKNSNELLSKRKELADLKSKILELEVYYNDPEKVNDLKSQASTLEHEISQLASEVYNRGRSTEGVSSDNLVSQWLEATLQLDESEARVKVLASNRNYYENVYNEISPLGSQLAKLERAVEVAENKYLELNNSLNWVLMKQQSETIATSGFTVTTPPTYPLQPVESKQLLLVLLAAVVGFIIPLAFVLLIEFLDNTVKTPVRGEEQTGLKIIGAYPDINSKAEHKNVDMDWLKNKSMGLISQNMRLEMRRLEKAGVGPRFVLIFSTRENDGKSYISELIANELAGHQKRILIVSPDLEADNEHVDTFNYENDTNFLGTQSLDDIIPEHFKENKYDFVFLELKGILANQYPIELIENFHMAICVLSAKRTWNKADKYALAEFTDTLGFKPRLLVNGVSPDYMDQVLGEIKKSRSALRKFLKGLVTMQFRSRKFKAGSTSNPDKKVAASTT